MSGRVAFASIAAKNFLAPARVLAASLREHHPEAPFYLLLADAPEARFDPAAEPFAVIALDALALPTPRSFLFRLGRREVCVATKPWLLSRLLDEGFDAVVYLDADMLVTGDLSALTATAARGAVGLTPHHLAPMQGAGGAEAETLFLRHGAFNAGLVTVAPSEEARRFLGWWRGRVYAEGAAGVFHDQQWLDLAFSMFEGVTVLRDPGLNAAYWNLVERDLLVTDGQARVGDADCRVLHFSGREGAQPGRISAHSGLTLEQIGSAAALFERYGALLAEAGHAECRTWPYAFDRFSDGSPIPNPARLILRLNPEAPGAEDPFDASGAFVAWLNEAGPNGLTRFWREVWRLRPDLQRAFPELQGRDAGRYLNWARETGRREHAVPEILWGFESGGA